MKAEIQKIMEMNKAGTISDDQAAELIATLAEGVKGSAATGEPKARKVADDEGGDHEPDLETMVSGLAERATKWAGKLIDKATTEGFTFASGKGRVRFGDDDSQDNNVTMSRFDPPTGERFEFKGNKIQVSSVGGLKLLDAEVTENSIQASKVQDLDLNDSKITDCAVNGSSVDRMKLTKSEISDTAFNGSRVLNLTLNGAEISDCGFNGVSLKGVTLEGGEISDCAFHGAALNDVTFVDSEISDCRFDGSNFSGCRFESVHLSDGKFRKCRMVGVTLKNVDLSDFAFEDVALSDQVIDGNDALKAALA